MIFSLFHRQHQHWFPSLNGNVIGSTKANKANWRIVMIINSYSIKCWTNSNSSKYAFKCSLKQRTKMNKLEMFWIFGHLFWWKSLTLCVTVMRVNGFQVALLFENEKLVFCFCFISSFWWNNVDWFQSIADNLSSLDHQLGFYRQLFIPIIIIIIIILIVIITY